MIWVLVIILVIIIGAAVISMFLQEARKDIEIMDKTMRAAMGIKLDEESHSSDDIESVRDELRKESRSD